ncbi:Ger(x)C family spore germination protein [Cohnella thailandensis]|uniref:Ger(X)C family spore germination protein n=1 Tax=Cohnella thailandensis TaxID=557557 RepID=A0A841T337_9BACL|nr:Ger(x)C family spore germination protein [Cohnella thailandensis]MBB6637025.1 Ger(x)C family spore germination protein [Cohnella thailandensis]MBP1973091.1 spore germination protein KC [Cohnella thailandensis]
MIGKRAASVGLLLSLLVTSGCWDSSEVNDIAIELAWGIDAADNNRIRISAQTIVPSKFSGGSNMGTGGGGGGKGKPYFVVSSDGLNTLDAVQRMQTKLSRRMFRGHRRVIVIGESMARRGIKEIFDTYSRDPNLKLRTDMFIVKGSTANDLLNVSYPLENIPGLGVLGEYGQMGTPQEVGLLNFLLAATSDGASMCLPTIVIGMNNASQGAQESEVRSNADKEEGFRIAGSGILDKELKLVGFLNLEESRAMRWVTGNLKKLTVSEQVPGEDGNVSIDLQRTRSRIQPAMQGGRLKIHITLTGRGAIRENNTRLDLTRTANIKELQKALNRHVEETTLRTIMKVQQEYGTDIFGFSDVIRRKDLSLWRSVKDDWEEEFRAAEVTVSANLTVRRIGVTGPALQLNPKEIKK